MYYILDYIPYTIYCILNAIYYLHYVLCIIYCIPYTVYYRQHIICYLLYAVYCILQNIYHMPHAIYCILDAMYYIPHTGHVFAWAPREQAVKDILDGLRSVPSSANTQPWTIVVVQGSARSMIGATYVPGGG